MLKVTWRLSWGFQAVFIVDVWHSSCVVQNAPAVSWQPRLQGSWATRHGQACRNISDSLYIWFWINFWPLFIRKLYCWLFFPSQLHGCLWDRGPQIKNVGSIAWLRSNNSVIQRWWNLIFFFFLFLSLVKSSLFQGLSFSSLCLGR